MSFYQEPPRLDNQFQSDRLLRNWLLWRLPKDVTDASWSRLDRLGRRAVEDLLNLGRDAEAHPPRHVPYDAWGRRIDEIEVHDAWKRLEAVSAEEGLVAAGYQRAYGSFSRAEQFARLYLFAPSSAIFTCPLAMTDGAARALELYGDEALKSRALVHLTSRDPATFWTSGQWMTERSGGSDVSGTETTARREGDHWVLRGSKYFTSATTSHMAMTLARIEGAEPGSRGLSLFYLELRDERGRLNNIRINRLKDKLGTRALPTAELELEGTRARLVGGEGHGVRKIASLFNITRIYNAMSAVAGMRRGIALARDYAHRRAAFGKRLAEHPLHLETLANLELEFQAAFHLLFHETLLLGRDECGEADSREKALLRLLTPVVKLYTARQGIAVASEVLECFGGAGYVEDTGLPQLLRDAQVLSIWEGTTNVLSLDVLRALDKERAFGPLIEDIEARLKGVTLPVLEGSVQRVREGRGRLERFMDEVPAHARDAMEASARALAYSIARVYAGALLLEYAQHRAKSGDDRSIEAARRWCARELTPLFNAGPSHRDASRAMALDP